MMFRSARTHDAREDDKTELERCFTYFHHDRRGSLTIVTDNPPNPLWNQIYFVQYYILDSLLMILAIGSRLRIGEDVLQTAGVFQFCHVLQTLTSNSSGRFLAKDSSNALCVETLENTFSSCMFQAMSEASLRHRCKLYVFKA